MRVNKPTKGEEFSQNQLLVGQLHPPSVGGRTAPRGPPMTSSSLQDHSWLKKKNLET